VEEFHECYVGERIMENPKGEMERKICSGNRKGGG
jgi:hypothetical protein